jgi:hypothetical protein
VKEYTKEDEEVKGTITPVVIELPVSDDHADCRINVDFKEEDTKEDEQGKITFTVVALELPTSEDERIIFTITSIAVEFNSMVRQLQYEIMRKNCRKYLTDMECIHILSLRNLCDEEAWNGYEIVDVWVRLPQVLIIFEE